jgi:methionyl-tRNA formyltransferase
LVSALQSMESGLLEFRDQSTVGVCYAHKIEKSEAEIDWTQSAETVCNQIHGLSPAPGAYSKILVGDRYEVVKILRAEVTEGAGTGSPGALLDEDMSVACGSGAIRVLQGQRSGRTTMKGRELMLSAKLAPGVVFTQSRAPSCVPQAGA